MIACITNCLGIQNIIVIITQCTCMHTCKCIIIISRAVVPSNWGWVTTHNSFGQYTIYTCICILNCLNLMIIIIQECVTVCIIQAQKASLVLFSACMHVLSVMRVSFNSYTVVVGMLRWTLVSLRWKRNKKINKVQHSISFPIFRHFNEWQAWINTK